MGTSLQRQIQRTNQPKLEQAKSPTEHTPSLTDGWKAASGAMGGAASSYGTAPLYPSLVQNKAGQASQAAQIHSAASLIQREEDKKKKDPSMDGYR